LQRAIGNQATLRLLQANPESLDVSRYVSSSRIPVYSKASMAIQPKLTISTPGDYSEREADKAAEEVMRMPDGLSSQVPDLHEGLAGPPALYRACSCGGQSGSGENEEVRRSPDMSLSTVEDSVVARAIDPNDLADSRPPEEIPGAVEKADEETTQPSMVQPKFAGGVAPETATDLAQSIDGACRNGGQPLAPAARQFMEPRFGYNFGGVRIHTDPTAGNLVRQVQARAFATRNHIFFAPGEFQPEQTNGKRLLAHELAHVVQQSEGSGGVDRKIQRLGNGGLNCPPYASYNKSVDLRAYNCAGLAHRTYDFKSLQDTKAALSKGTSVAGGTPCDHVGVVKHWLWEYDIRLEDSAGKVVAPTWQDFHTVGGPTDGDPVAKDSDEYYTKNGKRKVYGPGAGPSFKPVAKDQALANDPSETPMVDDKGQPIYKVRTNIVESCYCLPCPKSS
jgi:hypothetical protein